MDVWIRSSASACSSPAVPTLSTPPTAPSQPDGLRARILQRIVELTGPAPAPEKWASIGCTKLMLQLRVEPAELLTSLRAEFTANELVTARVAFAESTGDLRLSPIFGESAASFFMRVDA